MKIAVLVFSDVFDTGLAAVLDTLETAAALAPPEGVRFAPRVQRVGVRRRVTTHQGFRAETTPAPRTRPEVLIVPALGAKTPEGIDTSLARPELREACALVARYAAAGSLVLSACTGTFLLGEAGLLAGRQATTTWWLAPYFRARFPAALLEESRMLVESGPVITAGTALAHLDLALWLVRQQSPSLAQTVARHLLYDARPSQAPYVMSDHLAHQDPVVARFERWARANLAGFSLGEAARAVGTSERTLERRLRAVLGKSPLSFVRDLRVEHAIHRLQTTTEGIDEIALRVGYDDGVTLRALLREKTGRGLRELRRAGA